MSFFDRFFLKPSREEKEAFYRRMAESERVDQAAFDAKNRFEQALLELDEILQRENKQDATSKLVTKQR